jgi:hypothetical protein
MQNTNFIITNNNFQNLLENNTDEYLFVVKSLIVSNRTNNYSSLKVQLRDIRKPLVNLAYGINIRPNSTFNLFLQKDTGIFLEKGQSIYVSSIVGSVSVVCSYEMKINEDSGQASSSSSSSSEVSVFNQFLEVQVNNNSSSSSSNSVSLLSNEENTFTVLIKNSELSARIENASKYDVELPCSNFGNEEECPEGYSISGYLENCEDPPCDKICCPNPNSLGETVLSGRVYSGSKDYNSPWNFYIDPQSISLSFRSSVPTNAPVNLNPSEIQQKIGTEIPEGSEFYFSLNNSVKALEIIGPMHCYEPLTMSVVKNFDQVSGKFVLQTSCQGECENLVGDFCMDSQFKEIDDSYEKFKLDVSNEVFQSSYEDKLIYFLNNPFDVSSVPNFDNLQDLENYLNSKLYNSSSSSIDELGNVIFDYTSRMVSQNPEFPSALYLDFVENIVKSKIGGEYTETYFSFEVESSKELVEISSNLPELNEFSATIEIRQGRPWASGSILGSYYLKKGYDYSVLESILPIREGEYCIKVSFNGPEKSCIIGLSVESVE